MSEEYIKLELTGNNINDLFFILNEIKKGKKIKSIKQNFFILMTR